MPVANIIMRRYNIVQGLFLSFGSQSFYRDVASNWRGAAFGLLLILALLIALKMALFINSELSNFDRFYAPGYISQLPTITVNNGEATTPQAIPYMITEPTSSRPVLMIDTSREQIDTSANQAIVFLSRTHLAYRKSPDETKLYDLSQLDDMVVTQESAHHFIDFMANWLGWILAPFIFLGVYVLRLLLALAYAVIGLVVGIAMRVSLPFEAMLALAMVTAAPVVVTEFIFSLFSSGFNIPWLLSLGINLVLLAFAIHANKPDDNGQISASEAGP